MKNFKRTVPSELAAKMKDLAESIDFSELVSGWKESYGEQKLDEIQGNAVSGWIPKQDGGFTVSQLYASDIDSSYHFTVAQTDFVNNLSDDCYHAFLMDNKIDPEEELTEEQREEFYEYEREWFNDGALLSFDIFCDGFAEWKNGEKTVLLRLSINYKDAPYFREKYAEDIKQEILSIEEFMAEENAAIIERFKI